MKRLLPFLASSFLLFSSTLGFVGCDMSSPAANQPVAPASPLDQAINQYEKIAHEYVRVAKKHRAGDVSVTVRLIDLRDEVHKTAQKLQEQAPQMSPPQAQRVAAITAQTSPYL